MKNHAKAIKITESCFRLAKKLVKKELTEKQIEKIIKKHALEQGADRLSFTPIISSGKNASKIHPKKP